MPLHHLPSNQKCRCNFAAGKPSIVTDLPVYPKYLCIFSRCTFARVFLIIKYKNKGRLFQPIKLWREYVEICLTLAMDFLVKLFKQCKTQAKNAYNKLKKELNYTNLSAKMHFFLIRWHFLWYLHNKYFLCIFSKRVLSNISQSIEGYLDHVCVWM